MPGFLPQMPDTLPREGPSWSGSSELSGRFFGSLVLLRPRWLMLWVRTERGHQIEKGTWSWCVHCCLLRSGWTAPSVTSVSGFGILGLLPSTVQGRPLHPPALVLHHHLQRGQTLPEEQTAGEGECGKGPAGRGMALGETEQL